MLRKIAAVLRSAGVLIVVWLGLYATGWIAGVFPAPWKVWQPGQADATQEAEGSDGAETNENTNAETNANVVAEAEAAEAEAAENTEAENTAAESTAAENTAGTEAEAEAAVVAPVPENDAPPPNRAPEAAGESVARRFPICTADAAPTLDRVSLFGSGVELAIGCGEGVKIIALHDGAPLKIASASFPQEGERVPTHTVHRVAAGDMSESGAADLLIATTRTLEDETSHALFFVPRTSGGFGEPETLSNKRIRALALGALDARPGLDLAALVDPGRERRGRVEVIRGASHPSGTANLLAGRSPSSASVVDLDGDSHLDVVVLSTQAQVLLVHFGEGDGTFGRDEEHVIANAVESLVTDVDGDGRDDVLIGSTGLYYLRADADSREIIPIDAPPALRQISTLDVDGDGREDIVGMNGSTLTWLRRTGDGVAFEQKTLAVFPPSEAPTRVLVGSFDHEAGIDALALARTGSGFELLFVPQIHGAVKRADEARPIADAPIMLTVALEH